MFRKFRVITFTTGLELQMNAQEWMGMQNSIFKAIYASTCQLSALRFFSSKIFVPYFLKALVNNENEKFL